MYIYQIMSNNFGYIDIILLGMIAGFIILRLRNILGRKTGHEPKIYPDFTEKKFNVPNNNIKSFKQNYEVLEGQEKKEFLKGAEIAYEQIITSFAKGDKKSLKALLDKNMYARFSEVIDERKNKQIKYETTFIGLKSAKIIEFKKIENIYRVTVNFVSELITCVKDKDDKVIEGNPEVIKTVNDMWQFSKNMWSQNPTWYLVDTSSK